MAMFARVRWYHMVGGVAAYGAAAVGSYYAFAKPAPVPADGGPLDDEARRRVFDANAPHYDADIALHEKVAGIDGMRATLLAGVRGRVLELGGGTGRNLPHYPADGSVQLTLGDFSVGMLRQAEARLAALAAEGTGPGAGNVTLAALDAHALPFPDASFDAVVDTFGLCSFADPVRALREMGRVVRPGGHILLLEHGRSGTGHEWLSGWLDRHAEAHAHRHGCYWNRPIADLVGEAGLVVLSQRTRHLGTTYSLVCAPPARGGTTGQAGAPDSSAVR